MPLSLYKCFSLSVILIFSLILSIQDIRRQKVNLFIEWLAILTAFLLQIFLNQKNILPSILTSLAMGAFYFLVRKLTKNKLGMADVWFGFFQGLFLTPFLIPVCLGIEALTALLFFLIKKNKTGPVPFLPFMAIALTVCIMLY